MKLIFTSSSSTLTPPPTAVGSIVGPTAAPVTADGTTIIYATRDKGLLVREKRERIDALYIYII